GPHHAVRRRRPAVPPLLRQRRRHAHGHRRQRMDAARTHRRGPLAPVPPRRHRQARRRREQDGDGPDRAAGPQRVHDLDRRRHAAAVRRQLRRAAEQAGRADDGGGRRHAQPGRDGRRAARRHAGRMTVTRSNPPVEWLYAHRTRIFAVMMIGWFMSLMDVSIVNITIPTLEHDFETNLSTVSWVANAYNLVFAVLLITAGRLADQFGRKRFFIAGLFLFTLGSGLCAAAWDVGWLIGFRALQAVGAGLLAPLGFAITALIFPPQLRGRGLAMIAVVALAASGMGPVIGGVVVDVANWHWIFLINVPIGVVGLVLAWRWWPETYDLSASRRVDWVGAGLLSAGVGLFVYGLVEA